MYEETLSAAAHFTMFVPTLRSFGTDEQKAEWLTKAENCKILGSYVQTEVGHGTFVRGLETTAIYDPSTREFVLHSPAITAYKVSTSFYVDLKFISLHGIYAFYLIRSGGQVDSVTLSTILSSWLSSTHSESITDFNHSWCSFVMRRLTNH